MNLKETNDINTIVEENGKLKAQVRELRISVKSLYELCERYREKIKESEK